MNIYYAIGVVALAFITGLLIGFLKMKTGNQGATFLTKMFSTDPSVSWSRFHASIALYWGLAIVTVIVLRNSTLTEVPSLTGIIGLVGSIYGLGKGIEYAPKIFGKAPETTEAPQ